MLGGREIAERDGMVAIVGLPDGSEEYRAIEDLRDDELAAVFLVEWADGTRGVMDDDLMEALERSRRNWR